MNVLRMAAAIAVCLVMFLAVAGTRTQAQETSVLTVNITGARNANGQIAVALWSSADGFPGNTDKAVAKQMVSINPQTKSGVAVFAGLPHGVYAVMVFHDENKNGKLDTNILGIPSEGYGASNNPRLMAGPPKFDQAKFSLNQAAQTVDVKLLYW